MNNYDLKPSTTFIALDICQFRAGCSEQDVEDFISCFQPKGNPEARIEPDSERDTLRRRAH